MCGVAAFAEAEAICTQPCTAVASAVAQVPAVYECAAGNADAATAAARAQATALAPGPLVTYLSLVRLPWLILSGRGCCKHAAIVCTASLTHHLTSV